MQNSALVVLKPFLAIDFTATTIRNPMQAFLSAM
jgi:hypothetical protein